MKKITLLLLFLLNLQGFTQDAKEKIQLYLIENSSRLNLTTQDFSDFVIESTGNALR